MEEEIGTNAWLYASCDRSTKEQRQTNARDKRKLLPALSCRDTFTVSESDFNLEALPVIFASPAPSSPRLSLLGQLTAATRRISRLHDHGITNRIKSFFVSRLKSDRIQSLFSPTPSVSLPQTFTGPKRSPQYKMHLIPPSSSFCPIGKSAQKQNRHGRSTSSRTKGTQTTRRRTGRCIVNYCQCWPKSTAYKTQDYT